MPRDVFPGEGYDGDVQLAHHTPGHHNGEFWLDDGSSTLLNMGDIPDQGYFGVGNTQFERGEFDRQRWAMGDIAAEWAQLLARDSLDKLNSALGKVVDQLAGMGSFRKEAFNGYMRAKALQADAFKLAPPFISVPFAGPIPNPAVLPAMSAFQTAVQAVKFFARMVSQTAQLEVVFMKIEEQLWIKGLRTDADMVKTSIYQVRRFLNETSNMFIGLDPTNPIVPEYAKTLQALIQAGKDERAAWGVEQNAYLDPRWYEAYMKAADKIVPLPKAAGSGVGGGSLADAIHGMALGPLVIVALAAGIAIIVGTIIALVKLLPNANLKAEAAREILLKAQERKAAVEAQMRSQGKSQEEIDAAKVSIDKDTGRNVETMPEPTSLLGGLVGPLGIVLAAGVAYMALK